MQKRGYERKCILSVDDVLTIIRNDRHNNNMQFDGMHYDPYESRYSLFLEKGYECTKCGLAANIACFEKNNHTKKGKWHWNFYHRKKSGKEIMLTRDHIKPKSYGGNDKIENVQPMCEYCNSRKGNGAVKKPKDTDGVKISFEIADQLPRDEIAALVQSVMPIIDKTDTSNLQETLTSILYNHVSKGHNELPGSAKWKRYQKSYEEWQEQRKHLVARIRELEKLLDEK